MNRLTLIALASVFSFGVLAHEGGAPAEGGATGGATPPAAAAPTGGEELAKGKTAKPAPKKAEPKKETHKK